MRLKWAMTGLTTIMEIYVTRRTGELMVFHMDPAADIDGVRKAIHRVHPECPIEKICLFSANPYDTATMTLKNCMWMCMCMEEDIRVQLTSGADRLYFDLNVSDGDNFPYSHMTSLLFKYEEEPVKSFHSLAQGITYPSLEHMIRAHPEFPDAWKPQIVEQAVKKWDIIERTYSMKRREYLQWIAITATATATGTVYTAATDAIGEEGV